MEELDAQDPLSLLLAVSFVVLLFVVFLQDEVPPKERRSVVALFVLVPVAILLWLAFF